jgi:hypothetical protein
LNALSKNAKFAKFRAALQTGLTRGETSSWEKPVNCTKNSQMTKFSPNFLKFGLGVPNQVPCSVKEALAKIWSGSGVFLRFCALANRPWSTFVLAGIFDISLKP